jgi:PREDICTED: lysosomal alpha-N-acetyl glucosaminidase-like
MALNGINMPLVMLGQEYIWKKVYLKFGLNEMDVERYFTGPAFLSW